MDNNISRLVINSFLPRGAAGNVKKDGALDKYLDGIAEMFQNARERINSLAYIENPYLCEAALLPDLEREYGLNPGDYLPDELRRKKLAGIVYKREEEPVYGKLQDALDTAGFGKDGYGLRVYANESPAANPQDIIRYWSGSYYLVNGILFSSTIKYYGCGDMTCGELTACCGFYTGYEGILTEYFTPPSKYWGQVFFVGGEAVRGEDGSIERIEPAAVPQCGSRNCTG
jgi:hypothetical protein